MVVAGLAVPQPSSADHHGETPSDTTIDDSDGSVSSDTAQPVDDSDRQRDDSVDESRGGDTGDDGQDDSDETGDSGNDGVVVCASTGFDGARLIGKTGTVNETDPVEVDLVDGTYGVVLTSTDDNHDATASSQANEIWFIEGLNVDGEVVFTSETTVDLADDETEQTYEVGDVEAVGVVAVRAKHGHVSGRFNSIVPANVEFTAVGACPDPAADPGGPGTGVSDRSVPEIPDGLVEAIAEVTGDPRGIDFGDGAPAGMVEFEGGPALDGVKVMIDSSGGLASPNVSVTPDRFAGYALSQRVGVSNVFDINVTRPDAVNSAEITLPYDETLLDGADEAGLHIARFDEDAGIWVPVNSPATVDSEANTVTVTTGGFSRYAVVTGVESVGTSFVWSPEGTQAFFGNQAVTCTSGVAGNSVDVVFAIDSSLSMEDNDPGFARLDAAGAFLDAMSDDDRAAVIAFGNPAIVRQSLTSLNGGGRGDLEGTISGTTELLPSGTNIEDAMEKSNELLSFDGSDNQVKVIVLLTDGRQDLGPGEDPVDEGFIQTANARGTTVYTVGLGADADTALLNRISSQTGGRTVSAADPADLAAAYEGLVATIIDDGTDSDDDGLTDCEEVNGLFTIAQFFNPFNSETSNFPAGTAEATSFMFTSPDNPDSDGDGTVDGVEVERKQLADNPALTAAHPSLVERGLTTYFDQITGRADKFDTDSDGLKDPVFPALRETCTFQPVANSPSPFSYDSDNDGVNDKVECENAGMNPLGKEATDAYGVPGFRETILVAPAIYNKAGFPDPVVGATWQNDNADEFRTIMEQDAVFYDEDYNCVENCGLITSWAAAEPNDNGFGWCNSVFSGDCVTDAGQIQDKIRQIVEEQGAFDDDGLYKRGLVARQAAWSCFYLYGTDDRCQYDNFLDEAETQLGFVVVGRVGVTVVDISSRTLEERLRKDGGDGGPGNLPNEQTLRRIQRIAEVLAEGSKVFRDAQTTDTERQDRIEEILETCYQSNILETLSMIDQSAHPCDVYPIFMPSTFDAGDAARNDAQHIAANPADAVLNFQPRAQARERIRTDLASRGLNVGSPDVWYNQFDECDNRGSLACDEYPFFSSVQSGPGPNPAGNESPRASLLPMPSGPNSLEGNRYGVFTRATQCPTVNAGAPFIVAPKLGGTTPTDYRCPAG